MCGDYSYNGRYKKQFRIYYKTITDLAHTQPQNGVLDVSSYKYWGARDIYDTIIVTKWVKSISSTKIHKLANESDVAKIISVIRNEFKRALRARWKRIFKKCDPLKEDSPKHPWQIC